MRKDIFPDIQQPRYSYSKIMKNSCKAIRKKQLEEKFDKGYEQAVHRIETLMANRYTGRCSISLEMKGKKENNKKLPFHNYK